MNNFNDVFSAIKEHCGENDKVDDTCYNKLAAMLKNKNNYLSLSTYLDILQNLGLIKFCKSSLVITLTDKGRNTESLFTLKENSAG